MDAELGATKSGGGSGGMQRFAIVLTLVGLIGVLIFYWQVFFWVNTERTMGVAQRIFYLHVPAAWNAELGFGITALCSAIYLWLKDERLDWAAVAAAEAGMVFATLLLIEGSLWAKIAWGTYWTWEPRLTLTLLLWFIFLGYFMVRRSTDNSEHGKRFAAVLAIVGSLDIPLIHVSVLWFRSIHPKPVIMSADQPMNLEGDMLVTFFTALIAFTLLFLGLVAFRYGLERSQALVAQRLRRERSA